MVARAWRGGGPCSSKLAAAVLIASLVGVGWSDRAESLGETFSLTPTSGPSGTSVSVGGLGCAPGPTVSAQDYVQLDTTLPTTTKIPVAANGAWQGSFVVPAAAVAGPVLVTATCFTDGLPALLTSYVPQTFTVTSPPPTTTSPPPITTVPTAPTVPGPPGTIGPGGAAGSPAITSSPTSGNPTQQPAPDPDAQPDSSVGTSARTRGADVALSALDASRGMSSSSLGWLPWLLIGLVIGASSVFCVWSWRCRVNDREDLRDESGAETR